jgi:hypothetical protein
MRQQYREIRRKIVKGPPRQWWRGGDDACSMFARVWIAVAALEAAEAVLRQRSTHQDLRKVVQHASRFGAMLVERVRMDNRDGLFEVTRLEWIVEILDDVLALCVAAGVEGSEGW